MTEFRIEYTIQRLEPEAEDFTEIGFGSSGACSDLGDCVYAIQSDVTNGIWETEEGQPSPNDVVKGIQADHYEIGIEP